MLVVTLGHSARARGKEGASTIHGWFYGARIFYRKAAQSGDRPRKSASIGLLVKNRLRHSLKTTGIVNTASGISALQANTTGDANTANGAGALSNNTAGQQNTASGEDALTLNTTGDLNTADGRAALSNNTTGGSNIALGVYAGGNLTTGDNNIEIGNLGVAGDANMIRIGKQGTQTGTFVAGIFGSTVSSGVGVIVNSSGGHRSSSTEEISRRMGRV